MCMSSRDDDISKDWLFNHFLTFLINNYKLLLNLPLQTCVFMLLIQKFVPTNTCGTRENEIVKDKMFREIYEFLE